MRAVALLLALASVARADGIPDERSDRDRVPLHAARHPRNLAIEVPGERPLPNKLVLGGVGLVAVAAGTFGLVFHLKSRSSAADVSAHTATGIPWSADLQGIVDDNTDQRRSATIGYAIGGVAALALVIAYIATNPRSETTVIHTTAMVPIVSPVAGGATAGASWRF